MCVDGGWAEAVDVALANQGRVVVTRDGDRFGLTGWRVGTSTTEATGAALEEAEKAYLLFSELSAQRKLQVMIARVTEKQAS